MRKFLVLGLLATSACTPMSTGEPATASTAGRDMVEGVDFTRRPGQPPIEQTYPDAAGMPRDVQAYIIRHSDCTHWQGEPDFDAERRRQIERAVRETCTGVDALGRRIRARYRNDPAVIERLRDYGTVKS